MKPRFYRTSLCLAVSAWLVGAACAQSAPESAAPDGPSAAQDQSPMGVPPLPPAAAGPLTPLGNALREQGVEVGVVFFNANFHNPSTGISPGNSANYGQFAFKAGADLERLVGLPNTQLNIIEAWQRPSYNTSSYLFQTGSGFTPFPVMPESHDLANLTLVHRFADKRLRVEYGRMNLNWDFMFGDMCSGCLLSSQATVLNLPGPSKSVWGATMIYDLAPGTKVGLGVIEDNPSLWQQTTGWRWTTDTRQGWTGIANITSERSFGAAGTPYRMEAGVFHRSSRFDDPLYNADGTTQAENPMGTPLAHRGTTGVYAQGRRVVWSKSGAGTTENIAAYGGAVYAPGAGQAYPLEAYAGVEYGGFLPSNPLAMVGTTVRYIRLGERRAEYERLARRSFTTGLNMASGGMVPIVDERVPRNMFSFDLHGRIGLVPGIFLEGAVQYLKNPNANLAQFTTQRPRDGWMFSLMLVADLGTISGLSRPVGPKFH